jgi:hypothetical protein
VPTAAPTVEEISAVSEADGLYAGLCRTLDGAGSVPCSPAGLTLLPAGAHTRVTGWRLPHGDVGRDATVTVLPHPLAATERLDLVRVVPPATGARSSPGQAVPDPGATDPALLLAAVRLGLVARMVRLAVAHLSSRESEGRPLIERQLLHGVLADAIAALELCRHMLVRGTDGPGVAPGPGTAADLHAHLSETGWSVTTLFGGSGYLRDHPVRSLYVAELVHDAWVAPVPAHPREW